MNELLYIWKVEFGGLLRMSYSFLLLCINFHHCTVGGKNWYIVVSIFGWFVCWTDFFVNIYWQNLYLMVSHHFWIWSRVSPSRFRRKNVWLIVMHVITFQVILGVAISWDWRLVVQNINIFYVIGYIFMSRDSRIFNVVILDLIKFHLNSFFKLQFGCFNFSDNSVVKTHHIKPFFKECGNCINMIILVNDYWWKHFLVSFFTLVSSDCWIHKSLPAVLAVSIRQQH